MKVLIIGSGGREHALAWKLRQSNRVRQVYCAPGNGGICAEAECVAADVHSLDSLLDAAHRIQPDLTVVGPEGPLALGIVDEFQRRGLRIFGPKAAAAKLESSKSFAKEFMYRHRIPTALYAICDSGEEVRKNLDQFRAPIVVKADGLAAGKGTIVPASRDAAIDALRALMVDAHLGDAGRSVVIEDKLVGLDAGRMRQRPRQRRVALQGVERGGVRRRGPAAGRCRGAAPPGLHPRLGRASRRRSGLRRSGEGCGARSGAADPRTRARR